MLVITVLVLYILELCITDVINICSRATAFVIRGKHPELGPDRPPGSVHTYYNHHTAGILTPLKRQERTFLLKPSYNLKQSLTRSDMDGDLYLHVCTSKRDRQLASHGDCASAHDLTDSTRTCIYFTLSVSLSLSGRQTLVGTVLRTRTDASSRLSLGRTEFARSWVVAFRACMLLPLRQR